IGTYGLVCTKWVPRSRFHLFSHVRVMAIHRLSTLLDFIANRPSILFYIRHLQVDMGALVIDQGLLERMHHLPNLTSIRLRVVSTWVLPSEPESLFPHLRAWSSHSPSISHLHLDRFILGVPGQFECRDSLILAMLSCVPSVTSLTVGRDIKIFKDATTPVVPLPLQLSELTVVGLDVSHALFSSFIAHPPSSMPHLTFLDLDPPCAVEASAQTYLKRAGHSLRSIRAISLQGTNLTDFAFSCFQPQIPDILSCLPSADWNSITVYIQHSAGRIPWSAIDAELAHERFQHLRKFAVFDFHSHKFLTERTRSLLPAADARGILDLTV
ncbi:hypothetical protein FB45DRAFT_951694, partial [Roridomyces roridus]